MTPRTERAGGVDETPTGVPGAPDRLGDDYFLDTWSTPDPWGFEDRWYERRKRDLTVAALPDERYDHAIEPGCAQGLLTRRLAARCDRVTALELVPAVAERARQRCHDLPNVEVRTAALPEHWPPSGRGGVAVSADLVVASEVLYYLRPVGLERVLTGLDQVLAADGTLLAVHWRGPTDYPLSGDEVHGRLDEVPWLESVLRLEQDLFRLDVWTRR